MALERAELDDSDAAALSRLSALAFGREWKAPLAHLMNRRWRQVHRWSRGEQGVPAEVWPALRQYIQDELTGMKERRRKLELAIDECERRGRV